MEQRTCDQIANSFWFFLALLHPSKFRLKTKWRDLVPELNPQAPSLSAGSHAPDSSTLGDSLCLVGLLWSLHHWAWRWLIILDLLSFVGRVMSNYDASACFPLFSCYTHCFCLIRARLAHDTLPWPNIFWLFIYLYRGLSLIQFFQFTWHVLLMCCGG